ncbi:hypothetical protein [uncultured Roseibium sp.]|uniref:hypothetical protein n=1 Tax=uncultured Roseibium sp. TaxID=1936171 RepID=UPI0026104E6E|nr:hypothetical protein [uncultured Roseibium sp.]
MTDSANAVSEPVSDADIRGLWRRAFIKAPAEVPDFEDHETHVYWFQADSLFTDLRIPARFSNGLPVACLAELDQADLMALADAEGFAGRSSVVGSVCTWERVINLQGPETGRDIGRLQRTSGGLFEYGVNADFVELWLHQKINGTAPEGRVLTCDGGLWGFLISSESRFLFALDRPARKNLTLPWKEALAHALTNADRDQLADLFQAEYSFGRIVDGSAMIELSSHPNRVGAVLCDNLHAVSDKLETNHTRFDGQTLRRIWTAAELKV